METSMNEMETQSSFHSPPRRRRSTFFERRDSFVPQPPDEIDNLKNKIESCTGAERQNEKLSRYHDQLLSEKEQWKKEVKERRNKYNDLKQEFLLVTQSHNKPTISYSCLTTEDIKFLKGKPNIAKLVESQQKLHKSVMELRALYSRVNELDNVVLNDCEGKMKNITQYILEHSTVEPMEE